MGKSWNEKRSGKERIAKKVRGRETKRVGGIG